MGKVVVAGFERALIWLYDTTTGAATGQQASMSNGTISGAYNLSHVKNADAAVAQFTDLDIQGGDKITNTFRFGNAKLAPFDLVFSARDYALNNMIAGVTSITSNSHIIKTAYNDNSATQRAIGCAIQQVGQDEDGNQVYVTRIINKATASIRPGPAAFRGESDSILSITPIMSTKLFTGQAFGTGTNDINLNLTENKCTYVEYITFFPIHIATIKQDNSTSSFTLPYKPLSSVVTLGATPNELVIGGVPTAFSSVNTSTGAAVLAAAGTAAVLDVVTYTTNYVPS